jgi:hypothetical protein
MTDLERLAAALLAQWRTEGGPAHGPIAVGSVLDRTLPYRVARRILGIDVSEDYEALVLRLIAEEEGLVTVEPADAAEMARGTMAAKLPDLDVLQLLRSATLTFTPDALTRLEGVLPLRAQPPVEPSPWAAPTPPTVTEPAVETPVIPIRAVVAPADHTAVSPASPPPPAAPAPEFVTQVRFDPPAPACWSCTAALPAGRSVKFCPFCGADQREPTCPACSAAVERGWRHCPDCGEKLPAPDVSGG